MGRKAIENGLTKEMIIEEADKQFLHNDFSKVSMRSIASALGFSHGAIYYHFENKTELFKAVIEKYFMILNHMLDEVTQYSKIEGTKKLFLGFIMFGLNNQSQYNFMFVQRDGFIDPLALEAPRACLKKYVETLLQLHDHTLDETDLHATFISLHGFVLYYKGRVDCYEDAKPAAEHFIEFLLKTLLP